MTLPSVLVAACVLQGTANAPDGSPLARVAVVHGLSGQAMTVSAADGTFRVRVPDPADGEDVVLEFRARNRLPTVVRARCGETLEVTLDPVMAGVEVVDVSATRLDQDGDRTAARVDRLDAEHLAEAAGSSPSIAQAVQQLPGVGAIGRDGLTSAPTIRGLGRDRSLVLLEGMRISSDRGVGPTGSFVDPFLVGRVEVVRGAAGVAYGSGAVGGVLSLDLGQIPPVGGISGRIAGSTNGSGRLVAGRVGGPLAETWRGTFGAFHREHDDYAFPGDGNGPSGEARNSGFRNSGGVAVVERAASSGKLRLALVGTTAGDVGRPTTRNGRLDAIETEDHGLLAARWTDGGAARGRRTELGLGAHRPRTVNRAERFDGSGLRTRTGHTENGSWDLSGSFLAERPLSTGSWLVGMDAFARRAVDATETNVLFAPPGGLPLPAGPLQLVKNGARTDLGAFAAWKRSIGRDGGLVLAGRVDRSSRSADERSSSSWSAPSAHLGLVVPVGRQWALTGSAARSFRAPRIQELYFQGDRPGGSRLANPDLEPEKAWSGEVGLRWDRSGWSAAATFFGIRATDLIVQLPVDAAGDTLTNENESEGTIRGAEAQVGWDDAQGRGRWTLSYARILGKNELGEPLPDIPSSEIRATGAWRVISGGSGRDALVRLTVRAGGAKTPIPGSGEERWWSSALGTSGTGGDEEGHGGYARWDAGVRARLGFRTALDVSVTNLFDSRYLDRPESDAFPQPGRSLLVELTVGR